MAKLELKPKNECMWDEVSLGENMIRLDPGEGRIHTTRTFTAWEGGGEYNVARGLKRCFGLKTAFVSSIADNPIGRLLEDLMLQGGVDISHVNWVPYDGIGRDTRVGLNFTERGYGVRAAVGCPDRGNTAASQMKPGDVDWDKLFGEQGARWMHTGGIFAALSESAAELTIEAMKKAKEYGTIVSYDLNYRPSLWKSIGGIDKAQEVNKEIAKYVDVMIGNEEDFTASLGLHVDVDLEAAEEFDTSAFASMIENAIKFYPNFKAVATTMRNAKTATINDWSAICWYDGTLYESAKRPNLEILDRVGGGDSFASGLIYGFLTESGAQYAVDCGAAHGALAMTTPGDTTMVSFKEVEKVMGGGSARVDR